VLQMLARLLVVLLQCAVVAGFGRCVGGLCHSVLSWLDSFCGCARLGTPAALSSAQPQTGSVRRDTLCATALLSTVMRRILSPRPATA
jgi:hypothetical protein